MSELLARLRIMQEPPMVPPDVVCWDIICRTFKDAADEIERLRADQAHAVEAMLKQAQTIKSQAARLAEAERLLHECAAHEGAEGWSDYLRDDLEEFWAADQPSAAPCQPYNLPPGEHDWYRGECPRCGMKQPADKGTAP